MADLASALSALSDALDASAGIALEEARAPIVELAESARKRHGFLGDTVVVALAGGTGSGKSSLLNALAGAEVSPVGAIRPTTAQPLAWIPGNPEPGLVRLLDDLGLDRRVGHNHRLPVAVIDLPDYDSVEFEHRATVQALIPRVDAVIWVLDPQKYSDRALHRDYLVPLAGYADQFLFVLNQVDRLDDAGLAAVIDDLTRRLTSEGFDAPRIVTTAARPVDGSMQGIDRLVEEIGERFETKRTAHAKLRQDVRRAHDALVEATGVGRAPAAVTREQWVTARDRAVGDLVDLVSGPAMAERAELVGERLATARAAGPLGRLGAAFRRSRFGRAFGAGPDEVKPGEWWAQPGLERALGGLSRAVTDLSLDLGGQMGRTVRSDLTPEALDTAVRASVEGARSAVGELGPPVAKKWWTFAGIMQLALFVALAAGVAWIWVDGIDGGGFPWNVTLIVAVLAVSALLGLVTRASGRRAGRRRAAAHRSGVEQAIAEQIDLRIGTPVEAALSSRDTLAEALDTLARTLQEGG